MLPIHTILHPTDFSEHSGYALELAGALARDYGARLVLLHVALPPSVVGEAVLIPLLEDDLEDIKEQLQDLAVPDAKLRVKHRLERGDPATEILRVAQEDLADLIVMGTHGRAGLVRLLTGSVAEQVLRQATCPVLTVRTPLMDTAPSSGASTEERVEA